jgi:hypothetical protein
MCLPCHHPATIEEYTDKPTGSPLILHGPQSKWHIQQFIFLSCIHRHRKVFTKPLHSKDRQDTYKDTHTDRRVLWSTRVRLAQVPWYIYIYIYTKFYKDWCRNSKADRRDTQTGISHTPTLGKSAKNQMSSNQNTEARSSDPQGQTMGPENVCSNNYTYGMKRGEWHQHAETTCPHKH